ncbi:Xaa-Pro peptidase family protein [Tenacibaculum maritimum]|nr:Xaa-Pro peptidase family protein [Tenacibaculum maritimum]MDB0601840.1 Xaa-Pro peptidase family protein [Tenacibaculum maritimum]MDB0613361.1 Xaa-Pro peptidase family protein [Tenacibaculum maritimum]
MIGIGGATIAEELNKIKANKNAVQPIQKEEFKERIQKAARLMKAQEVQAMYVHAGTNLFYFTGTRWNPSERMVGAVLFPDGKVVYIAPAFEKGTILDFMLIEGAVSCWEEHESPYEAFSTVLHQNNVRSGEIMVDETTPFFVIDGINKVQNTYALINAKPITAACRMVKSKNEIAIIQAAMDITMEVQRAAARILRVGISTKEVVDFIDEAHKRHGIPSGSYFCIVLFGVDSSFPHGVKSPKNLEENEVVLIDTGCVLHHYISDITRTYVFGEASEEQRTIWNIEKEVQQAAFDTAQLGNTAADVDAAARKVLVKHGLGPDYKLPGLPHRTGHGIGLDIHEYPYMVKNDETTLEVGMCFSNEPMICMPNKFGIRHEDHIYITSEGPRWFTSPAYSIEAPFGRE